MAVKRHMNLACFFLLGVALAEMRSGSTTNPDNTALLMTKMHVSDVKKHGALSQQPQACSASACNTILDSCKSVQPWSKGDNGCEAYANGWGQGNYFCDGCSATVQDYACCNIDQCNAFCDDMYANDHHSNDCKAGCAYMNSHSGASCCAACSASACNTILESCKLVQPVTKGDNGCEAYAHGWEQGNYFCDGCSTTVQDYACCDIDQCNAFCDDMYANNHHNNDCKAGCAYMNSPSGASCCPVNQCTCTHGSGATGAACPTNGAAKCATCSSGYTLNNDVCQVNQCTCTYGTGATGPACPTNGNAKCATCSNGYTLNNDACQVNQCTCTYGTGATGPACPTNGNAKCATCSNGYTLNNDACQGSWITMNGNGFCMNAAESRYGPARTLVSRSDGTTCEDVETLCADDPHCVAYACPSRNERFAHMYTTKPPDAPCSHPHWDCENTDWINSPNLITQAGCGWLNNNVCRADSWESSITCRVKAM